MNTTYCGIFPNGDHIEDISIHRVAAIPDVIYILSKETETTIGPITYTLIDRDGNTYHLDKGNFRLLHLGADGKFAGANRREIKIKDTRLDKIHAYKATTSGIRFFHEEVLPLLEKLNEIGSWEMYQKLKELAEAYKEIDQLKTQVKTLEAKLVNC